MKLMGGMALAVLVLASVFPGAVRAGKGAGAPSGIVKRAPAAPRAALPRGAIVVPLPDSVLARIPGGADITRSRFDRAVRRLDARPDSLTPQQRRQFLDLLIDQGLLAARVAREPRLWTARDSAEWLALRDRLLLNAALDSALTAAAAARDAHRDSVLRPRELGILARDSAVVTLHPRYDTALLARVAAAFDSLPRQSAGMSVMEQMRVIGLTPHVAAQDSGRVLVQTAIGSYTAGDLLREFGKLNPVYRPRVSRPDDVRDLVNNMVFQDLLRRHAEEQRLVERPEIAAALAEKAEFIDISKLIAREVYAKIAMDSLTLRRHFAANLPEWDLGARAVVLRMVMDRRADAEQMLRRLTVPGEAESLAASSARGGVPYATVIAQDVDGALYAKLKRAGVAASLGPDSTAQGWRVLHVLRLEPRRHRPYVEVADLVKKDWYDREGERRIRQLLDGLRREQPVIVNERALARLGARRSAPRS